MGIKFENIATAKKVDTQKSKTSFLNREISLFGNSFSNKAKEQFYSELSVLLNSGVNLKRALDLISEMQNKQKDKKLIDDISNQIVAGSSLSEALQRNKNFTPYEYQAIKIGEQTGQLNKITNDLREFFNRKTELSRQLISSLSYPLIVLITACGVVFFMLRYVVPMFVDIFKQNRVELPWLTKIIVKLSGFVVNNGWIVLILIVLMTILFKVVSKKEWYYRFIGDLQIRIPVMGNYIKKIYLIQFAQAMALLTNARIPVVSGIALVREMIRFYPLEKTLVTVEKDIVQGKKLFESFAEHSFYDKKLIALLKVAEETNQTEYIFQKLYDQYRMEIKYQGQIISKILNFLLTLFVGLIVGVILVAMYLPMFKLSSVIG
ncbi:type II secretion system F family protein [Aequorivita sp. KMM 9714]|uniref:type II secretion system F family protein n=1 Tax=Aequorivita sp. KMM 9714 TaxID=2707173 RepID=UPI0013EC87D1|nr:type II secretion system F family protein [Aequorivita sp. KMM 9714]NGX85378.1 type II secretion system F family protein [Aequorivita sp. KMM 9714]